jgi:hypothetical protein
MPGQSNVGWVLVAAAAAVGCGGVGCGNKEAATTSPADGGVAGDAGTSAAGPVVTIPAGALKAGTPCGGVPRITNEELVGESIQMGEFAIDVLPYPNDPTKPMRTDVSRDEAAGLCAAQGKRLCTELEWERACKGPNNTTFEYGAGHNQANCKIATDLLPDKRPKCVSAFGVKDMHGLAWEWTASSWGRGQSGDLATIRGGQGPLPVLQFRCANGQGRPPANKGKDVGFRCCSGPVNAAAVNLAPQKQAPMVEEPAVETNLAAAMLKAMPPDHRAVPEATVAFDKVWRWHPRDNEELLIGRWRGARRTGKPWHELAIFKVCGNVPGLVARMRGPVEVLDKPGAGSDPQKVSAQVSTGSDRGDVKLSYSYGTVTVEQPAFVKAGNSLAEETPDAGADAAGPKRPVIRLPRKK